jgi:hypothetical protein
VQHYLSFCLCVIKDLRNSLLQEYSWKIFRTGSSPVLSECRRKFNFFSGNLPDARLKFYKLFQHLKVISASCSIVLQLTNQIFPFFFLRFQLHQPCSIQMYVIWSVTLRAVIALYINFVLFIMLSVWQVKGEYFMKYMRALCSLAFTHRNSFPSAIVEILCHLMKSLDRMQYPRLVNDFWGESLAHLYQKRETLLEHRTTASPKWWLGGRHEDCLFAQPVQAISGFWWHAVPAIGHQL